MSNDNQHRIMLLLGMIEEQIVRVTRAAATIYRDEFGKKHHRSPSREEVAAYLDTNPQTRELLDAFEKIARGSIRKNEVLHLARRFQSELDARQTELFLMGVDPREFTKMIHTIRKHEWERERERRKTASTTPRKTTMAKPTPMRRIRARKK